MLIFEKFIRDPIHDYIQITKIEKEIIDSKYFQRLRGINQNALAHFVYPGLRNSRFEHSMGVMHLAGKMISNLTDKRYHSEPKFYFIKEWLMDLAIKYSAFRRIKYKDNNEIKNMLKIKLKGYSKLQNKCFELLNFAEKYQKTILQFQIFIDILSDVLNKKYSIENKDTFQIICRFFNFLLTKKDSEFKKEINNISTKLNSYFLNEIKEIGVEIECEFLEEFNDVKDLKGILELEYKIQEIISFIYDQFDNEKEYSEKIIQPMIKVLDINQIIEHMRIAALLHDVGHLPFSHAFEHAKNHLRYQKQIFKDVLFDHEEITKKILINYYKKIYDSNGINWDLISFILNSKFNFDPIFILKSIISSQIDADRADYLLRDQYMGGYESGKFDLERLTSNLLVYKRFKNKKVDEKIRLKSYMLSFDIKVLSSVTRLITERYNQTRWLHFHHTIMLTDDLISKVISLLLVHNYFNPTGNDTILTLLKNDLPLFSPNNELIFLDEAFVIKELREKTEDIQKEFFDSQKKYVLINSKIRNLKPIVESLISRKNLPIPLFKYISTYWDIIIDGLSKAIRINRKKSIQDEMPEYSSTDTSARNSSILFINNIFIKNKITHFLEPECTFTIELINEFSMKLKKLFKECDDEWYNLIMCKKTKLPYDINEEIILIGSDNNPYLLSDLSWIIYNLIFDYELKVPKLLFYIQCNEREKIVSKMPEIQRLFKETLIDVVSGKTGKIPVDLEIIMQGLIETKSDINKLFRTIKKIE